MAVLIPGFRYRAGARSALGLFGLLFCISACGGSTHKSSAPLTSTDSIKASPAGWVLYRDPSGVSMRKPTSWTVTAGIEGPLVIYIDPASGVPFRRNINVLHQVEPQAVTLSQYSDVTEQELQGIRDFVQSSLGPVTLSGHPAMRTVYSGTLPGTSEKLEVLSEWTIIGGKPWLVTYTSDPSRFKEPLASVQRLIDSIQFPSQS